MANKEYQKLGRKYGSGIYELFQYFHAVKIFTYEGDGVFSYQKEIIGYLNEMKEIIDIRTGEKFPAADLSSNMIPKINELCYRTKDLLPIDEQLFEREAEKDAIGASTTTYDIYFFGDTIRYMDNFVITTDAFTKLDYFEPIRLTKQEKDERKKRQLLYEKSSIFEQIRCVKLCGVSSMDVSTNGKRRKSRLRWYQADSHVPVYFDSDTSLATDLRDGITQYELLEFVPTKKNLFSKWTKQTEVELSDAQYDRIKKDIMDDRTHKYIENMSSITWFDAKYFTYKQLEEIVKNYEKLLHDQLINNSFISGYQYKK